LCATHSPNMRMPIGPITAGMMIAGRRYSGSLRPPFLAVILFAITSISFPPKNEAKIAPMNPDIESKPRSPVCQLYGLLVKVRLEVSCTTIFLVSISMLCTDIACYGTYHPTKAPIVMPTQATGGYAAMVTVFTKVPTKLAFLFLPERRESSAR